MAAPCSARYAPDGRSARRTTRRVRRRSCGDCGRGCADRRRGARQSRATARHSARRSARHDVGDRRIAARRRARCRGALPGAHRRRERHRQGAGRARDPPGSARRAKAFCTSTARRCPRTWSNRSCSATRAAPSPAPRRARRACSRKPTAARSSSTKSASCPRAQAKLLRVLQEARSGASARPCRADRRAHRRRHQPRLPQEVDAGRFRPICYYRLDVVHSRCPAARPGRRHPVPRRDFWRDSTARVGSRAVLASPTQPRWRSTTGRGTSASCRTCSRLWRSAARSGASFRRQRCRRPS